MPVLSNSLRRIYERIRPISPDVANRLIDIEKKLMKPYQRFDLVAFMVKLYVIAYGYYVPEVKPVSDALEREWTTRNSKFTFSLPQFRMVIKALADSREKGIFAPDVIPNDIEWADMGYIVANLKSALNQLDYGVVVK